MRQFMVFPGACWIFTENSSGITCPLKSISATCPGSSGRGLVSSLRVESQSWTLRSGAPVEFLTAQRTGAAAGLVGSGNDADGVAGDVPQAEQNISTAQAMADRLVFMLPSL